LINIRKPIHSYAGNAPLKIHHYQLVPAMMRERSVEICHDLDLHEKSFVTVDLLYKKELKNAIVFRFKNNLFAYLNQCVHMPKALNCQSKTIFDQEQNLLRCSMHGIVYDPETGQSLSTMCHDKKLVPLRVALVNEKIFIDDKRVKPVLADATL
jgi:nitrite reductase/ring-hydroxylating ferredoxin subunit